MPITVPPPVLRTAAVRFGVDPGGLDALERGGAPDGAVFRCRRDGLHAFLKIKPVAADALDAERDRIDVVRYLRGRIGVVRYLRSGSDELLEVVEHEGARYVATLGERAPGRHVRIGEDFTPTFVRAWAGTLGRLHAALRDYDGGTHLPTWREEHAGFLDSCRDDAVGQVWRELGEEMGRLPTEPAGYGVVHNDLHAGNLLMTDDGDLTVLDFDVCSRHWYATDLAILLVHPIWDLRRQDPAAIQPFVDTALESYTAAFPLDPSHLAHTPLLMRYRMALFVLAMAGELGDAPRPPWLAEIRTWVLSGEPVADIRIG